VHVVRRQGAEKAHVTAFAGLQMLSMIAQSSEFENVAVREEELPELDRLVHDSAPFDARGGAENRHGKVSILLQVSALCIRR
jgi:activating signal cointegrator complex subunit 3